MNLTTPRGLSRKMTNYAASKGLSRKMTSFPVRFSSPKANQFFRAGTGPGQGPTKDPINGPTAVPDKGRDCRAAAQWSGPRICNPKGWSVDPGNGQKWDKRVQEGSVWPDLAKKRNLNSNWDNPDGFRDLKRPFSIENGMPAGIF